MSRARSSASARPVPGDQPAPSTRLAVIGAGRFARFILEAAAAVPQVVTTIVADTDGDTATRLADDTGCRSASVEEALAATDVDAVVIATPPRTHAAIAQAAMRAGKDVFCEKPLAVTADDAARTRALAESLGRVMVVDHVMRYNPLLRAMQSVQSHLGLTPIRFLFENDAADESLPRDHWFWDESVSGGIFIEHAVHFFDAAAMFVSEPASAVSAVSTSREGWPSPDLVTATVVHGDCLATQTHSFTHAHRCERQLMRIDYGSAEVRVAGWIPVEAVIDAHVDAAGEAAVRKLVADPGFVSLAPELADWHVEVHATDVAGDVEASGRGRRFGASRRLSITLSLGGEVAKERVYAACVAAALRDLHDCRVTPGREPVSGPRTAERAVLLADCATRAVSLGRTVVVPHVDHSPAKDAS